MKEEESKESEIKEERAPNELSARALEEGVDYYMEGRYMVFTAEFLRRRGYCCESGCRHCPYKSDSDEGSKDQF